MREELESKEGVRTTFYGIFNRFGTHPKTKKKTVLLINIRNKKGKLLSDHNWFNLTKGFGNLELKQGTYVKFNARVKEYRKGSIKRGIPVEYDYKLSHPSKLSVIEKFPFE